MGPRWGTDHGGTSILLRHHGDQCQQPRLPAGAHDRRRGASVATHHLAQLAVQVERGEVGGEGERDAQQCVQWHLDQG